MGQERLLEGINRIFREAITSQSQEHIGTVCLSVAQELTESEIGFIGDLFTDGELYDFISEPAWTLCTMDDGSGHGAPPRPSRDRGLYGYVLKHGTSLLTNDPSSHPASIGLPKGHPPLSAFLGVPLMDNGRTIGLIAVGNRRDGYTAQQQRLLEALAPAVVQVLLRKRAEDEVRRSRDELERRVTERTRELTEAHLALKESEARYKDLYDQANDIIFTVDLEGRFTGANAKAIRLFRKDPPPDDPATLKDVLLPESYRRAARVMAKAISRNSDLEIEQPWEFEARTKEGGIAVVEVKAIVLRHKGTVTGMQGIARDITQRKRLEEERVKLSSAVERAGEGIFMLSLDRCYTYVNNAFCNAYGYHRDELMGKSTATTRGDRHDQLFHNSIWQDLQAGKMWSGRQTRKRKDGAPLETEATIVPIRDASGAIIHFVGVERDIGPQLQLEEQVRQSQKMEAIGTLAGGIAHDFNNMLAVILGNAELALEDVKDAEGPAENIEQIVKASKRARELVKQILTFTRKTERGRGALKLTPVIKETYKMLRGTLPTTIRMELHLKTQSDVVLADPSQIQQVLLNLATNAAYAMRREGGILSFSLSEATVTRDGLPDADMAPGTYTKLTVQDTGTGMTEKVATRIFEPFFTTKGAGKGTGMGLAVVYGIVKNHEGAITVESEPGKGSTFNVFLPCLNASISQQRAAAGNIARGNERVLLIDDEPSVVRMTGGILERLGYEVRGCESATEGLSLFLADPDEFDLVITDQTMPDMTGIELARRMLEARGDVPIVLFTGYSETVSPEKAKLAGIREFLMKPVAKRELAQTVRRALDGRNE